MSRGNPSAEIGADADVKFGSTKFLRMPQFCVVRPVSGKVSDEKGRNFVKPHKFQQLYRKSGRRESLHANDEGNRFWIRKYI